MASSSDSTIIPLGSAREWRRAHLRRLVEQARSQREFVNAAGLDYAYINQILNGHRNMGEEMARKIERNLHLPFGPLDRPSEVDPGVVGVFSEPLGGRVKRFREDLGWDVDALAENSGVRSDTIPEIESGVIRQTTDLVHIASALGVTLEVLLGGLDLASRATVTIETTNRVARDLDALVATGLFGMSREEAAERVLSEALRKMELGDES